MESLLFLSFFLFLVSCRKECEHPVWRVLPIRSEEQFNLKQIGGEAEQHMQGMDRSLSNPNVIYLSHDCGQVWVSKNGGDSWHKTLGKKLYTSFGQSIRVDPIQENVVYIIGSSWWMNNPSSGLWKSSDYGDTFYQVSRSEAAHSRSYESNIDFDKSTIDQKGAKRWFYGAWNTNNEEDHGIYMSNDYGESFTRLTNLFSDSSIRIYSLKVHPSNQKVYVASSIGLFLIDCHRTENTTYTPQKLSNGLPTDHLYSLEVLEDAIFVVCKSFGLFKSDDGGNSFFEMKAFESARHVFAHNHTIYFFGNGGNEWGVDYNGFVSKDDGRSWMKLEMNKPPKPWAKHKIYRFTGNMAGISINPQKPGEAVAFMNAQIWKTTNYKTWNDSSTLFTGFNCDSGRSVIWDENNPKKFAMFHQDVGSTLTLNNGKFFHHKPIVKWSSKVIPWMTMNTGAFHRSGTQMIAAVGGNWGKRICTTESDDSDWKIYTYNSTAVTVDEELNPLGKYRIIFFHPTNDDLCFAGRKKSMDGGISFLDIDFLKANDIEIHGKCYDPKTKIFVIYAIIHSTRTIYRSFDNGDNWEVFMISKFSLKDYIVFHPSNCNVYWAADVYLKDLVRYDHNTKEVRYHNFLETNNITIPRGYNNFPLNLAIDPTNSSIVYTSLYLTGSEKLIFRTVDDGKTWQDISFNVPRLSGFSMVVSPYTGELMIGGCAGTFIFPSSYKSLHDSVYDTSAHIICYDEESEEEETINEGINPNTIIMVFVVVALILVFFVLLLVVGLIIIFVTKTQFKKDKNDLELQNRTIK